MSEPAPTAPVVRAARRHRCRRGVRTLLLGWLVLGFAFSGTAGCRRSGGTGNVALVARDLSSRDPQRLEIHAQYSASSENLRFCWFADHGECEPQESSTPLTIFRFAEDKPADRVTVDVWQGGKRIGQQWIDVKMNAAWPVPPPDLRIEITQLPPAAKGGPETRADIAGRVTGALKSDYKVLVYARDEGIWYLQPRAYSRLDIGADGAWSTWTHLGHSYAVVVVSAEHVPIRTLDVIPSVRGPYLARLVVDGRKE